MDIRPIKTKSDHRAALKEVERLWNADPGTPDGARVDVLVTLIEAYETKHFPIPAPDPIAAIAFMMEQRGLTRRDLKPAIDSRGVVSEVLTRKRPLTLPMVRDLNAYWTFRRLSSCNITKHDPLLRPSHSAAPTPPHASGAGSRIRPVS